MQELFNSGMWRSTLGVRNEGQAPIFQPVGGMGMIGKAFAKALPGLIKYNCKVTAIRQDEKGVTAVYVDTKKGGAPQISHADWCICTIPTTILSQIPMTVGAPLKNAINSWSYAAAFKVGLHFKRRFWEEDDNIYGGISYTDQPISTIGYPATGYFSGRGGVLLGGYIAGDSVRDFEFEAMPASEMIKAAIEQGSKIHPQYSKEFVSGVAVAWHRVPWSLGCAGISTEENRAKNYDNLCAIDGRIVLAGEHCSRVSGWQEGAVLSALDTIKRLHQKVLSV
jgi:monoamine oxidase